MVQAELARAKRGLTDRLTRIATMDESVSFTSRSVVLAVTLGRCRYEGKGFSAGYCFR
jgi:hypothetical protein